LKLQKARDSDVGGELDHPISRKMQTKKERESKIET